MPESLKGRLDRLSGRDGASGLFGGLRGIEREALRVDRQATLAQTPHPRSLGAALTHPHITTDYSEALIELITPPVDSIDALIASLEDIHTVAYAGLGDEFLWGHSMPCPLPGEDDIPIARYGASHIGRLKHVYRRGLALRYGKAMQCIAGIHYNFSVPDAWWTLFGPTDYPGLPRQDVQSAAYMAMIRNFHRYSWLLMVLFGASPACCASFVRNGPQVLERLSDDTLYLPYATSLRMSDLGYQNSVQSQFSVSTDSLCRYVAGLQKVVTQTYPAYEAFGTRQDGDWVQINTNVLQIENEYYSTIRPKRVCLPGERPVQALSRRGVQYLEVRCMDVDPFTPAGIDAEAARFLDAFLFFCLLEPSADLSDAAQQENKANFQRAVKEGRRPGAFLHRDGAPVDLRVWAATLLDQVSMVAARMDAERGGSTFRETVDRQRAKIDTLELTPSHRVLSEIAACANSFAAFGLRQSRRHADHFQFRELADAERRRYTEMAESSFLEQQAIEAADHGSFEQYLERFNRGIHECAQAGEPGPDQPDAGIETGDGPLCSCRTA